MSRLPDPKQEPTLSVKRGAYVLGVSPRVLYTEIERDNCPHIRVGRRVLLPTLKFLVHYQLAEVVRE
jgi:hypothetical protein